MPNTNPTIQSINFSDARRGLSLLLNQVFRREKQVVITKSGIPVAIIIAMADFERLISLDEQKQRDFAVIDEARAAFAGVDPDVIECEVAKAVAEVKADIRQERLANDQLTAAGV